VTAPAEEVARQVGRCFTRRPRPHELPVYVPEGVAPLLREPFKMAPERLRRSQLSCRLDPERVVEVNSPALLRFLSNREHVRADADLAPDRRLDVS
jgi:hypothetical protein